MQNFNFCCCKCDITDCRFNQLYPRVDEVYQLELLLLELKQQLMVAMATREEETILKALREGKLINNYLILAFTMPYLEK